MVTYLTYRIIIIYHRALGSVQVTMVDRFDVERILNTAQVYGWGHLGSGAIPRDHIAIIEGL